MLQVHHLNNSRSQRVLWLLEELELPYEAVLHQRDPQTNLSPASLRAVHPLGKSPLLIDAGQPVIESGAILEYIVRRHGGGRLAPKESAPEYPRYLQLMHYAEGSAMLPLLLRLYLRRLGDAGAPLEPRVTSEIENHLGYLHAELGAQPWFLGEELSAADIHLSFVFQFGRYLHGLDKFPNLTRFLAQAESRPAYRRALERGGGPYIFGS
jgi:glutathione S-transferase